MESVVAVTVSVELVEVIAAQQRASVNEMVSGWFVGWFHDNNKRSSGR